MTLVVDADTCSSCCSVYGLVEFGVGVIPGGGGQELALRASDYSIKMMLS
jgi:enoyl-CoA hydratase/carnithine racemase